MTDPDPGPAPAVWWRGLARVSVAMWSATALAFLATIVAARALGPDTYGLVVVAVGAASFIGGVLDLSLEEAVLHHGASAIDQGDIHRLRRVLRVSLVVDIAIGIAVALIVVFGASIVADVAGIGGRSSLIRMAAVLTLVTTVNGTSTGVLLLARRADLQGVAQAAGAVLQLLLLLLLLATEKATPVLVMGAMVVGAATVSLVQGLVAVMLVRRRWPVATDPLVRAPWQAETLELVRFGFHTSLSTSITALSGHLLPVLVARSAGLSAAAFLRVAQFPFAAAGLASAPARSVLLPEQAARAASSDTSGLRDTVWTYTRVSLAVGAPAAVVGLVAMPWLVELLYSDRYADAVDIARIFVGPALIMFAMGWAKMLPAAIGRPELRTRNMLLIAVITVVGTLLFGATAEAAAWATFAAYVAYALVWAVLLGRLLPIREPGTG